MRPLQRVARTFAIGTLAAGILLPSAAQSSAPPANSSPAAVTSPPAAAAAPSVAVPSSDPWTQCRSRQPDIVIAGCTVIINRVDEPSSDVAAAFNNRAVAYGHKGEFERAIADFDQAISLKSNYLEVAGDAVTSLVESGGESIGILGEPEETDHAPDAALFYKNRGVAWYSLGKYARAMQDFTQAMALHHDYIEAILDRGIANADAGNYDAAIDDYNSALEIRPKDPAPYVDRGSLYARQEKYSLALADFNHAIALRPDYAGAYSSRCMLQAIQGKLQPALADCNIALDINPSLPSAFDGRGFTYLKLGQYEQARADYAASLKLAAHNPGALYGRGMAEQMLGDGDAAAADVAAAEKMDSGIEDEFARWGISAMRAMPKQTPAQVQKQNTK